MINTLLKATVFSVALLFSNFAYADIDLNKIEADMYAEYTPYIEGVLPEFKDEADFILDDFVKNISKVMAKDGNYKKYLEMKAIIAKHPNWEEDASYIAALLNVDMSLPTGSEDLMENPEFVEMVRVLNIWHETFLHNMVPLVRMFNMSLSGYFPIHIEDE